MPILSSLTYTPGDSSETCLAKVLSLLSTNFTFDRNGALKTTATLTGDVTATNEPLVVTTCAPTTANVTATSGVVLAANANRTSAVIVNSGANDVYLSRSGTAVAGSGVLIRPYGAYEINATGLYKGSISAICATGKTSTLSIEEGV